MTLVAEDPLSVAPPPVRPCLDALLDEAEASLERFGLEPPFAFSFRWRGMRIDASCAADTTPSTLRLVAAPLVIPYTAEDALARGRLLSLVGGTLDVPPLRFVTTFVQGIRFESEMAMERLDKAAIIGTAVALLVRAKPYFELLEEWGGLPTRSIPSSVT